MTQGMSNLESLTEWDRGPIPLRNPQIAMIEHASNKLGCTASLPRHEPRALSWRTPIAGYLARRSMVRDRLRRRSSRWLLHHPKGSALGKRGSS